MRQKLASSNSTRLLPCPCRKHIQRLHVNAPVSFHLHHCILWFWIDWFTLLPPMQVFLLPLILTSHLLFLLGIWSPSSLLPSVCIQDLTWIVPDRRQHMLCLVMSLPLHTLVILLLCDRLRTTYLWCHSDQLVSVILWGYVQGLSESTVAWHHPFWSVQ